MAKCFLSSLSGLCTMKIWSRSSHLLLKLIYITLLPVPEAQEVRVSPEVTGYLGHEVTLPCQFIQGPDASISQFQWDFLPPEGQKINIIVSSPQRGVNIPDSPLKERLEIAEQSLIIKDVQMADEGSYTCSIATFPSGSFEGTTNLVVKEQLQLSTGEVSAIVTAVVLLLVITTAMAFLFFLKRRDSSVRHRVFIDTTSPVRDVARPSIIVREEDVVYSDVKLKPSRDATPSSNDKHRGTDDVTYSEVVVSRRQSK